MAVILTYVSHYFVSFISIALCRSFIPLDDASSSHHSAQRSSAPCELRPILITKEFLAHSKPPFYARAVTTCQQAA